jgi:DNA-binding winged helix-turn-helix (wHTH) protein/Tol biopolymer transport system component
LPVSESPSLIRFGTFELEVRSGELRRNGSRIRLQDQPLQVLLTLLDRPGQVVTREELHAKLWPADTFVDFDHGLNAAVKRLRDALGDTADNPRYIETLARKGYRFVAPVVSNTNLSAAVMSPSAVAGAVPAQQRHLKLFMAGCAILLVGSLVGWLIARSVRPAWPQEHRLTANPSDLPVLRGVVSPDGKYLAYADRTGVFLRDIASREAHAVSLPDEFKAVPTGWFPDNSHLLLTRLPLPGQKPSVWSVSVLGGSPQMMVDDAWVGVISADGLQLAFSRGRNYSESIWTVPVAGGEPRKVAGDSGEIFGSVAWSADARYLAFMRTTFRAAYHEGDPSIVVADVTTGRLNTLLSNPRLEDSLAWSSDGRLIYSELEPPPNPRESNLWALKIDSQTGRATDNPTRLTMGPDRKTNPSISSNGKVLSFLRRTAQSELYIGELSEDSRKLTSSKRLTLEEGTNQPYAWTADAQSILFISDRDGSRHLFRQTPSQGAPDQLVGGNNRVMIARMNPSGSAILYSVTPQERQDILPISIMSVPVTSGSPRLLFKDIGIANFQCARLPSTVCVVGRESPPDLIFSTFDSESGALMEWMRIQDESALKFNWSLSPDGSQLVMAEWMHQVNPAELIIVSLKDKSRRYLKIDGWTDVRSLDWGADSQTIWVGAANPAGTQAVLRVDMKGNATPFVLDDEHDLGWAIPSPDGRRIAYWKATGTSNAWMLQGF